MKTVLAGVALLAAVAALVLFALIWRGDQPFGIAAVWERLAGSADQGPVAFEALQRRPGGNDALFCPPGRCEGLRVDGVSPVFAATVQRLRDVIRVIVVNDPDITLVSREEGSQDERYVARSRIMRYPDTIQIRYVDLGGGRSSLILYSRSLVGRSDFGANRARLEGWLATLRKTVPVAQP